SGERHEVRELVYFLGHESSSQEAPDWIVDVTATFEIKLQALRAYETQFYSPGSRQSEPPTEISSPEFWESIERRSRRWGRSIGVAHAEPFSFQRPAHLDHHFVQLISLEMDHDASESG
ncbi:hypothetical protein IIC65_03430, partial [Candidatus Sumerlaeota bacterium]|nr:hypothetical protein [Candidatus Sumerlaeota bacterium]